MVMNAYWALSPRAFERLLEQLSDEPADAAQQYNSIHQRLVAFFEVRGVAGPELLADKVMDCVARRLEQGETIEHLKAYCHGVARRVLLEWQRREARERSAWRERAHSADGRTWPGTPHDDDEARVGCLEHWLSALPEDSRALLLGYYQGPGRGYDPARQLLARQLGIPYVTLRSRVHRIRRRLESTLRDCAGACGHSPCSERGPGTVTGTGWRPILDGDALLSRAPKGGPARARVRSGSLSQ
jgi:DNA-directed RNA polymerase specialized sigma24 family protein